MITMRRPKPQRVSRDEVIAKPVKRDSTRHAAWALTAATALNALLLPVQHAHAVDTKNPDWPCVQAKVENLTATQIWDGPAITGEEKWWEDDGVRKLVPQIVSRRNPIEDVEAKIEAFAQATPEAERDARMTLLFAGVLDETNKRRRRVVEGLERYQRRQRARSKALEAKGAELAALHRKADGGANLSAQIDRLQRSYDWDARIFKQRQDNIPLACEIPVEIGQRAFAVGRTIRYQMSE